MDPTTPTTTFISGCNNLKVVRKGARKVPIGEMGDFVEKAGEYYQFMDGRLVVSDARDVDWLKAHSSNGTLFHELGMGAEGHTSDDTAAVISSIFALAFEANYQRIADILVAERSTLSRATVTAACEAALEGGAASVPADLDAALV